MSASVPSFLGHRGNWPDASSSTIASSITVTDLPGEGTAVLPGGPPTGNSLGPTETLVGDCHQAQEPMIGFLSINRVRATRIRSMSGTLVLCGRIGSWGFARNELSDA